MADYSYAPGGYVTGDEPIVSSTAEGADKPLTPWQRQVIVAAAARNRQRRELSFSLQFPRQLMPGPPLWLAQLFGVTVTPAPPTVREAAVDVWDALRVFMRVLFAAVAAVFAAVGDRVADWWYDAVYGVLDRWDALRAPYAWGRLPGPVVRFWSADMSYVGTMRSKPEHVVVWLRRLAAHVWQAVRHG
ncbi:hypothetical protein SEA_LASTHOPE_93 [Mycobacterium phage LastHope]|uniref:Uncharacterized protein n=1 Tax=Mycobacterium phage LastHope TaxID=2015886 RepID=A0A222ZTE0_9CAUD|nr:hypothetical protein I5G99_gp015 [Mycobacterium phage LastHope]ASR87260.1 hypothetical protein SEA_LASTHOPE_93 [Mycobacterium phage LastHope]